MPSSVFIVMLCRSWSPRRLLTVGIGVLLAVALLAIWGNLYSVVANHFSPDLSRMKQVIALNTEAYRAGFYASLVASLMDWKSDLVHGLVVGILFFGPLMLIGLGLFKLDFSPVDCG